MIAAAALPPDRKLEPQRRSADVGMICEVAVRRRRRRRILRPLVGLAVVAAVVGTGAGLAALGPEAASTSNLVRCHSNSNLGSGNSFEGTSDSLAEPVTRSASGVTSAVSACYSLWMGGVLSLDSSVADRLQGSSAQTPELYACRDRDGTAAVFPGESGICAAVGLPPLAP